MTGAWRLGVLLLPLALAGCLDDGDGGGGPRGADRGERTVVSVELTTRPLRPVVAACRAAAGEESLRVPAVCPQLVPDLKILTERDDPNLILPSPPTWYELTFNTAVAEPGHWIVGVGRPRAARESVLSDRFHEVEGLPRLVQRFRAAGARVAVYWYPPPGGAMHRGHVIAFVQGRNLALWASIHGRRYADAALAMVLDMARVAFSRDE
jgi:hypothetical protein